MRRHQKYLLCFCFFPITLSAVAQKLSFNRYKVSVYEGRRAKVIIKGNPLAENYRTTIREGYKATGLNFAGHYCLVYWGCGSDCQHAAIVDLKTGIVYDGPTAANLFDYERWSRLVVVNRLEFVGDKTCAFCKPEFWVWNERLKKFNRIK
jgi:hypothetical protein